MPLVWGRFFEKNLSIILTGKSPGIPAKSDVLRRFEAAVPPESPISPERAQS